MDPASVPLSWSTALTSWQLDVGAVALTVAASVAYGWAWRRVAAGARRCAWWFAVGVALVIVASMGVVAVYATVLFWVRALQVLLLL
jgi:hypothetical protein